MTDIEIIAGLRGGDKRSYETLYNKYYRRIRFFADQYVDNLETAHEITIESFVTLWKKRNDFDSVSNIKAFLFITTKNACFNHIKHLKRKKRAHEDILSRSEKETDNILNDVIEADILDHIFRESEMLSDKCKNVIQLRYKDGLSYKEIAHHLHISVENVRVQHANAVNGLRILLKKKGLLFLAVICTFMFM